MNGKLVRVLTACAAGLQTVTLLITYFLYANQEAVKRIFTDAERLVKIDTFPFVHFAMCIIPAILYFAFLGFQLHIKEKLGEWKAGTIVFFALACGINIGMEYFPRWASILAAREGVDYMASYSLLGNAISAFTRPFFIAAFGLFALSAGGSIFMPKTIKETKEERYWS